MALILGLSRCANALIYGFPALPSRFSNLITFKSAIASTNPQLSVTLQQRGLASLPIELKLHVLGFIADVPTLRNLCLASREFYDFSIQDATIIGDALYRELGRDNFLEAYLVVSAANMQRQYSNDSHKVQNFLQKRHDISQTANGLARPTVEETHQMCRLLDRVRYFVTDFAKFALRIVGSCDLPGSDRRDLTATEIKRITRALLRTQLCHELFPFRDMDIPLCVEEDLRFEFLHYYPAWQCEELVCIRQYLMSRMTPIFQDVQNEYSKNPLVFVRMAPWEYTEMKGPLPRGFKYIPDDWVPEWFNPCHDGGVNLVESSSLVSNVKQRHLLPMIKNRQIAEGLEHLYRLFTATTTTDRVHVFETAFSLTSYNDKERGMFDDFEYQNERILRENPLAAEAYYHEDFEEFNFEEDGPNAGWFWAHSNSFYPFFNEPEKIKVRHWGYVMWDKQRLQSWNIFGGEPPATRRYRQLFSADWAHECQRTQRNKSVDPEQVSNAVESSSSPIENDLEGPGHDNQPSPATIDFELADDQHDTAILDIRDTKEPVLTIKHITSSEHDSHVDLHPNNTNDAEQVMKHDCDTTQCTVQTAIAAAEDQEDLEDDASTSSNSNSPRLIFSFSSTSGSPPSSDSDPDSPKTPCWNASLSEINIDFTQKKSTVPVRRIKPMRQRRARKTDNVDQDSCTKEASNKEANNKEIKSLPAPIDESIPMSSVIEIIPQNQHAETETDPWISRIEDSVVETETKVVPIDATKYSIEELAAWIQGKPLPNKPKAGKWSKMNKKKKIKRAQVVA